LADDKVDDESAQTGGEDESAAPKKSFGILAARFLQKGKSSPGSITGEFEALTPPESPPAPDSKMRKLHPVDEDEDEIREGSIHGMEVPLSESLYADIGLDDMSGYDDAPESDYSNAAGVIHAGSVDSAPPEIVYDIDAGEQPAISSGSGIAHEHASDIELAGGYSTEPAIANDESAQYEEQAGAYDEQAQYQDDSVASDEQVQYQDHAVTNDEQIRYHEESVASDEHVQSQVQYEAQPVAQANQYDEPQSGLEAADYNAPVQFEEQSVQQEEHPYAQEASTDYQDQAAVSEEPAQFEEPALSTESAVAHDAPVSYDKETVASQIDSQTYSYDDVSDSDEHSVVDGESTVHFAEHHEEKFAEHQEDQQVASSAEQSHANQSESRAYDLSALDAIGVKNDASFDKNALDEIGTGKEVSQGSPVSEAPVPEKKGLLGKFAGKKESTSRPTIGGGVKADVPEPKAETYDSAALESIGTKGFDKSALDSIGTKGFDKNALDSIGTKGFDKNALDSIGTQGSDKNALDSIGTRDFDKGSLDAIGEPAAPATDAKDKAAKGGGLLGGKFGQKAKGLDKPKLGGINPPSVDPTFDQKETGRFMVNADTFDAISASQNLTNEATQDFSAPVEETPALQPPPEEEAAAEKEPLSASFFDETDAPYGEEHTPVIGSDEIGRLITDADNAYRLHQYKAAEPIFANVLEKLDKAGDDTDPLLPYCLDKMADNLYKLKKYKESLQQFRRLLVLHTKLGSSDRDMIATLYKIAQTCEVQNLTSEADSMYKRAFRLGQQSLVPGDPLLAKVLEGYGTMLMRSEGAEAPSATSSEKTEEPPVRAAEVQSALSAEEIAMLNSLGASSDRSASEPSPIILSGGPSGPPEQAISKSRSPLKESDERADRVRATGPSGGSTAGSVWVRLGLFLSVIVGLILVTLNIKTDYSSHHVAHSKDFVKRVYKSADGGATFTIVSEDQASKDNFGKHFAYDYRDWNGTPGDDIEVISGQVNGDNFIYEIPQGIRDGGGYVFYEPKAAELSVVAKMHELGNKAQAFFKSKNKYPESKDLENIAKSIAYKNPFAEGAESVTANSIAWPPSLDATQIMMKSRFDTGMENGELWEGEPAAKPGQISAASASQKQPDASVLYIHGRDRDGKLITRADGKVLVLIYKNGIDVTPGAADLRNEKPGPTPTPMRLSKKDGSITALTILLSYIPIAIFFALSLVFLVMLNKGTGRVGGFSIPTFGIIWSPIMVLLTGLAKFVPAAYSTACLAIAGVVFVGGAGWLLFNILKNQPKKPKKS
jgi:tetratricopeptide (TPR) repeat protein